MNIRTLGNVLTNEATPSGRAFAKKELQMNNKTKYGLLAAFAIAATAIPLTVSNAIAQEPPSQAGPGQGAPPAGPQGGFRPGQGQGQGFPPQGDRPFQPGQGGPMMGGGGGGGTTMVEEGAFLYIVQGNRMYKVNKGDLKVAAQGELPRPMGGPAGAPPGQPGGGGGNRGGGGGGGDSTEKPK
jgi:hypothetical protein